MKQTWADFYDAVVVGGGPAGASAAIHLAAGGARVLLAEQKKFPREKLCGEFISPECLAHFSRLGVGHVMRGAGGSEVERTIFYTQSGRSIVVPSEWLGAREGVGGGEKIALGLSRAEMDRLLLARARAVGVEVLEDASASLVLEEGRARGVRLNTREGERMYEARVTIDATGRARALARRAEAEAAGDAHGVHGAARDARRQAGRRRAPYVAFKAHLENTCGARATCEIYFYRGGYGGLSPVEAGRSNLCFIVRARDVRRCGSDAMRVMREIVMTNERARATLEGARVSTAWLGVALESFGRSEPVAAEGLLSVGDAASFIDPFTGSGMLMALESGQLAARAIARWLPQARAACAGGRDESRFAALADEYRALYEAQFGRRLRLCGLLRRAAFAPRLVAESAVFVLSANKLLRRRLARATRGREASDLAARG